MGRGRGSSVPRNKLKEVETDIYKIPIEDRPAHIHRWREILLYPPWPIEKRMPNPRDWEMIRGRTGSSPAFMNISPDFMLSYVFGICYVMLAYVVLV